MTVEEIEILVTARVEEALKDIPKLVPTIKKVVEQSQTALKNMNTEVFREKLHQVVQFAKKKITDLKKSTQNNEIAIKVNNKEAKQQVTQLEKEIDSLQKKISASQIKLNLITPKLDKITAKTIEEVTPEGISSNNPAIQNVVNNSLANNKEYSKLSIQEEKIIQQIEEYNRQLDIAKSKMAQLSQETTQTATSQNKLTSFFSGFKGKLEQVKGSISNIKQGFSQIPKITQNITNNIKKMNTGIKTGLGHVLKYVTALFSIRGIYSILSQSAQNWLSSQNAGAQQLSANIEYMKYAMGSALAPVIQFVTNLVYQLMKAIQSVVYAFSGINIFAKATAKSMNNVAGSAKKANKEAKQLAGVHNEINNISDSNSSNSGNNGNATPNIDLSKVDTNMNKWLSKWKKSIATLFEPLKKAWKKEGQATIDSAKNAFTKVKDTIVSMAKSWIEVWTNGTGQNSIELILRIFQNIFDIIGNISNAWNNAWNKDNRGTILIQAMWDALNKLLELVEILTNKIEEFVSSPLVQEYFENAIDLVTNFWNALSGLLDFLTGVFTGDWERAWTGLKDFVSGIFGLIWNLINDKLIMIKGFISNTLDTINTIWKSIWEGIKNFASNIWNGLLDKIDSVFPGMRDIIETIINTIKTKISNALNNIKTTWNNIWNGLKTTISNVWNGIWSIIKKVINSILGGIEKMVNGIANGLNNVIRGLNNIKFTIPDWVPNIGGKGFGININTIGTISLPRLAKGGIIDSPTVALMGEYPGASQNPEITAPQSIMYDTMKRAIEDTEFNSNNNGQALNITIMVGNKKLGQILLDDLRDRKRQTGKNIEALIGG